MAQIPNGGTEPDINADESLVEDDQNQRRRKHIKVLTWVGAVSLIGLGGGLTYGWIFIHQQLAPLVTKSLTEALNRPVKVGEVEKFSLGGIHFGATEIPATPLDADTARVEAVQVAFDPLKLLLQQKLSLNITLIDPQVYIEQDVDGAFLELDLKEQEEESALEIDVQKVAFKNAQITIVPRLNEEQLKPVTARLNSGYANLLNDNQLIQFDTKGTVGQGKLTLSGESRPQIGKTDLQLGLQKLDVAAFVSDLFPEELQGKPVPVNLKTGQISAKTNIAVTKNAVIKVTGTANLTNIQTKLTQQPDLPTFTTNGKLRFLGQEVRLEDFTTLIGDLPIQIVGTAGLESGYNLTATSQPTKIDKLLQIVNLKKPLPVPVSGELATTVQLNGAISQPRLSGLVTTTKTTQIDKVAFKSINAKARLLEGNLVVADFLAIPTLGGQINGNSQVFLGKGGNIALNVRANNLPTANLARLYNTDLPIPVGNLVGQAKITGSLNQLDNLDINGAAQVNVAGGTVVAREIQVQDNKWQGKVEARGIRLANVPQLPAQLQQGSVDGVFNLAGNLKSVKPETIDVKGNAQLDFAGGTVNASNIRVSQGGWQSDVNVAGVQLSKIEGLPQQLQQAGSVNSEINISGRLDDWDLDAIAAQGSAAVTMAGGTITANQLQLNQGNWRGNIRAAGVELGKLANVPVPLRGRVNGNFLASGSLDNLDLAAIKAKGNANLRLPRDGGTLNLNNVQLANNLWQAQVQTQSLQLAQLTPQIPSQLGSSLSGNFNLRGNLDNLNPQGINGSGNGKLRLAGGNLDTTAQINNGSWQATVAATGVEASRFASLLPRNLRTYSAQLGDFGGNFQLNGNLSNLTAQGINLRGDATLEMAGGALTANNLRLKNGDFQAVVTPNNIQLSALAPQLQGDLDGRINLRGNVANLNPKGIQASGEVNLSEGVALVNGPVTALFDWNGERLTLPQLQAPNLDVNGFVDLNLARTGLDIVQQMNLNIDAQGLELAQISGNLPQAVADANVLGNVDFRGTVTGTPKAPGVNGDIALHNLAFSAPPNVDLKFDPLLQGKVTANPRQGSQLQLVGENDRIEVALDANYLPTSLALRLDEFVAEGQRRGDELLVSAKNLPLAPVKEFALFAMQQFPQLAPQIPRQVLSQTVAGNLASEVRVNVKTGDSSGEVAIAAPVFGTLAGDSLTSQFSYRGGVATIPAATFQQGESQYKLFDGRFQPTPAGPKIQAKVEVEQGDIQQILKMAGIYSFADLGNYTADPSEYGNAADIGILSVGGSPNSTIYQQLGRLAMVEDIQQQQESQQKNDYIPELEELAGKFSGTLDFAQSPTKGTQAKFAFQGDEWQWGEYDFERIVAQGKFDQGNLTISPISLQLGQKSFISFAGNLGETQSGQLKLRNVPVELIAEVVELPPTLDLSGMINATAAIAGTKDNPQAKGEINVIDGTINSEPIQSAQGSFTYNKARLQFAGTSLLQEDSDPLTVNASIPYKLPFAEQEPKSNQLSLNVDVKDEGLILLSLLSNGKVTWMDGKGEVKLDVSGTFDQKEFRTDDLIAQGIVNLEDAVISAQLLPEAPVTDINGKIVFNFDQIEVENLEGSFSDGKIAARGILPITQPGNVGQPLTISLEQLAMNLKGIYEGGVQGNVKITGSALKPEIGGNIEVFDGRILLPESRNGNVATASSGGTQRRNEFFTFNDLLLTLENNVEVAKPPILGVVATGSLNLNGSLQEPRPEGTIQLERGAVNLFATQLRLDGGYRNVAVFTPNQGFDPNLDLRLATSVTELARQPVLTNASSAEVSLSPDLSLTSAGGSQTVRIEARVSGAASKLSGDNAPIVDLSSSPRRSKTEIVSLLGGSLINSFAQDATVGIANIASSAVFGSLQDTIRQTLGLSEFRIFPTSVPQGEGGDPQLSLGAEAGVNVTDKFSISVLKIFAEDRPAQYSVQYRINDNTFVRGTTDLAGNNGAAVQYEIRF